MSLLPTLSLFDPTTTKPFEISSGCQDVVKDINPATAAIFGNVSRYWPAAGRTDEVHRRIELIETLRRSHAGSLAFTVHLRYGATEKQRREDSSVANLFG
jgi:hypothetical protein